MAVAPQPRPALSEAAVSAGASVEPLSEATRGLIWAGGPAADLGATLDEFPGIGWVQLPLAGVENYAEVMAAHPDLLWTSAKGAYSEPVAEHAVALTLGLLRMLPEKSRSSSWAHRKQGISLYGCKVVIVGAGGVALEIIRLLAPFEVSITIVRRSADPVEGADRTIAASDLPSVLPEADVVILAAAATGETTKLIGAKELAVMKPEAVLVNIARGRLVDTDALVASLESGHLWGAGLDVTDPEPLPDGHPMWSAPRCVITSHAADTDEMVEPLLAARVAANTRAFLQLDGSKGFVGIVDARAGY